jgi:hypothetical protein
MPTVAVILGFRLDLSLEIHKKIEKFTEKEIENSFGIILGVTAIIVASFTLTVICCINKQLVKPIK